MSSPPPLSEYQKRLKIGDATLSPIVHGDAIIATVYMVTRGSGESLILKISSQPEEYHRERYFLECLTGAIPIPRVRGVVEPEDGVAGAILMERLPGSIPSDSDWTEALAYEVGVTLATVHSDRRNAFGDLTKEDRLVSDPALYFGDKFEEELAECRDHLSDEVISSCQELYDTHRNRLASVDGPCVIHRDFRPGNLLVADGKLQGVIDWAGGRSGFAEQDFIFLDCWKDPEQTKFRDAFLKGYESVRPLPNFEKIMPLIRLGRALAMIGFTVRSGTWNGSHRTIYERAVSQLEAVLAGGNR